jgi:hypothetical protein
MKCLWESFEVTAIYKGNHICDCINYQGLIKNMKYQKVNSSSSHYKAKSLCQTI